MEGLEQVGMVVFNYEHDQLSRLGNQKHLFNFSNGVGHDQLVAVRVEEVNACAFDQ